MKMRKRVAIVCNFNQLGGKNQRLRDLYRYLNGDDLKIFIFYCSKVAGEVRDFMIREGVKEEDLIFLSRFKKWMIIPFILELKRKFLDKQIDIVHTLEIQTDILGLLAARLAGIKYVFSLFESKIIPDNISFIKQLFYRIGNKMVRNKFLKTIVVSEELKKELISANLRPADKIMVLPLGINIPYRYRNYKFNPSRLREKRPFIGAISRFSKEKGLERFIKAMPLILEKLPDAQFIIVGKGPEEKNMKRKADELGLNSKITFKGWTEDVFYALESIDIFVMPSVREGCPHSLLEALALCRPVVASKIEGISAIVESGKDGLLVDTSDSKQFADAVLFLGSNPDEAAEMGKRGSKKVADYFSIKKEMDYMKRLYLEIAEINNDYESSI